MKKYLVICFSLATGTANAQQTLDQRYIFDPQKKDPTEIAQMISRLDREADIFEFKRNNQIQQLQNITKSTSTLRAAKFSDPSPIQIPAQLAEKLNSNRITESSLKPLVPELERLSVAIKAIQSSPMFDDVLSDPTLRSSLPLQFRQTKSRSSPICNLDDFDYAVTMIKLSQDNSDKEVDIKSCIQYAQNPPKPEMERLSAIAELERIATELRQALEDTNKTISIIIENKAKWTNQLHNTVDISSNLLTYTIPLLGGVVILLMGIPILYNKETQASIIATGSFSKFLQCSC